MGLQMLIANTRGFLLQVKRRDWIAKIDWGKVDFATVNPSNCKVGGELSS
jgi:hypothetical protein